MPPPPDAATWLRSDRFLARSVARPVNRFLHIEASGGVLLVAAAVVALVWANSPWSAVLRRPVARPSSPSTSAATPSPRTSATGSTTG